MIRQLHQQQVVDLTASITTGDFEPIFRAADKPTTLLTLETASHQGLLSCVQVFSQTDDTGFAIKTVTNKGEPILGALTPEDLFRNETDFFESAANQIRHLPHVYAVASDMILMAKYPKSLELDQEAGLTLDNAISVLRALGNLHSTLSSTGGSVKFSSSVKPWTYTLSLAKNTLDQFRNLIPPAELRSWNWLESSQVTPLIESISTWSNRNSWTICSMDMRAGNILGNPDSPCFIDWQFAERAPGGFDVATLIGTSGPVLHSRTEARFLIDQYADSCVRSPAQCWDEFCVGVVARALFTVTVGVLLPHSTPLDVAARGLAISRLSGLLDLVGEDAFSLLRE
jgi:thiamine kinase-like enzyme